MEKWSNKRKNFWWLNQRIKFVRLSHREGVHALNDKGVILWSFSDEALRLPFKGFKKLALESFGKAEI